MRRTCWVVPLLVALLTMSFCPMMAEGQEPTRTVVFNELMWMGSTASDNDEWIELRNITDSDIDISGWLITKLKTGDEDSMLTVPPGNVIPAYGIFLISNYDSSNSKLNIKPDLVNSDVILANSALQLKLYAINGEDTTLVDVADDGVGTPLAGSNDTPKASMVRKYSADPDSFPKADDGTMHESWDTATYAQGWDDGASEKGTPGFLEPSAVLRIVLPDTVVYRATIAVPILVEDVIDLYSANLYIVYEDEHFEYVSTEEADFLDSTQTELLVSEDADEVNVGIARMEPIGGISGSGTLVTMTFKAITEDAAQTYISFEKDILRNAELGLIWVSSTGDTVTIETLTITDTFPDDSDSNVIASAPVAATFDHHPACSVDSTKFYLTFGSDTLFSAVVYDSMSRRATLPDSVLLADMTYTAVLDSSLGMTDNYTWTFRTSVLGDIFDLDDPTDADLTDDYIGDGLVDGDDLAVLGYFYYTAPDSERWSPVADLDRSDKVDGGDLVLLGINYGRTSSTHAPKLVAQRADAPLLRLVYDEEAISEGQECVVTVIGERMRDVYALDIGIGFDEDRWEMVRVEKGALLGDRAAVIHGWDGSLLRIGATRLGRVCGVDGDGAMVSVTFRTKQSGPPVFRLGRAAVRDSELKLVPVRIGPAVSVGATESSDLPKRYALSQNFPNPFNAHTEIAYALPAVGDVRLRIYNTAGQWVRTLVDGRQAAGRYVAHWDGRDARGKEVATGVYFYLLTVRGSHARWARKMLLLR